MKRTLVTLMACSLALSVSCGSGSKSKFEDSPDLQGKPPSPDEDPFFYAALPPPDAKADTKGTIGDADTRATTDEQIRKDDEPDDGVDVDSLRARVRRAEVARDKAEAEALALQSENLELKQKLEERRDQEKRQPAASSDPNQCHACVKICPLEGNCAADAELVCGWGAGKNRKDAMARATAECDGALEQMRQTGPWTRIEGKCPVARCL